MNKGIAYILDGRKKHITEAEWVWQPLPHTDFRFANPFIVLHHSDVMTVQPGAHNRIPPHPHRGFSPVTFFFRGAGFHQDSAGHYGTVKQGGVQWMFAGKGLLHSEGPTEEMLRTGGEQEFVQLWINVPAAEKMGEPYYQRAEQDELPRVLEQEGVNLHLASGTFENSTGPMKSFTPVVSVFGSIDKEKEITVNATPGYWTLLYILDGSVTINGAQTIAGHNLVIFEKDNSEITVTANENSHVLYLSAEPINEPVAAKDNYVMNTPAEIDTAMADYKAGKFGTLDY